MDFAFSQEQDMLRDSVARFLEKTYDFDTRQKRVASGDPWSAEVWGQFAELGLLALPFSEADGGLGGSISDCVAFAQSFGKHLVIEPYAHTVMMAGAAMAASGHPATGEWIGRIAAGEAIAALAYEEGNGTSAPHMIQMQARRTEGGFALSGEKRLVIAGADADALIVAARIGEGDPIGLFLVEQGAPGMSVSPYTTVDGCSAANIRFDAVAVEPGQVLHEDAEDLLEQTLRNAIIVLGAEAVGAMAALLAITSEYAMTRKQFGQPIGMFQTVAHRLADMKIAYTKAFSTLTYTTALANSGAATARDIAVFKGQLGKLGRAIGEAAIQTHGGVGLTDELSVSHYHKRLLAFDAQLGDHTYHLRKVGQR